METKDLRDKEYKNYFTINPVANNRDDKEKYIEIVEVKDKELISYTKVEDNFNKIFDIVGDNPIILHDKNYLKDFDIELKNSIFETGKHEIPDAIWETEKVKVLTDILRVKVKSFKKKFKITTESIGLEYTLFELYDFCEKNNISMQD